MHFTTCAVHCLHYASASGPRCKIIASPIICGLAATTTFYICPVEARQDSVAPKLIPIL